MKKGKASVVIKGGVLGGALVPAAKAAKELANTTNPEPNKTMTLADFDTVMGLYMNCHEMAAHLKFWLVDEWYRHFKELNGVTAHEARLKEAGNGSARPDPASAD